jgi:hypothetical protein
MAATERTATLSSPSPAADRPAPGGPPRLATHTDAVAAAHAFAEAIADGVVERDRSGAAPHGEMARRWSCRDATNAGGLAAAPERGHALLRLGSVS